MFFKCTIPDCEKLFNCKKALKEHERTHNQDRPFKCDLCDQTFTQYSSLQKHARVHDKKKPYQCDSEGCNQAFSQVSNLIRHQRIHTGDKPYVCEYCDKKFASGSNLKQHLQIHDKQDSRNQFVCMFEECGKNYLYQSSLKKHYLMSHKDEYETYLKNEAIETCGFHMKTEAQDESKQESGSVNQNEGSSIGSVSQAAPVAKKVQKLFKPEKNAIVSVKNQQDVDEAKAVAPSTFSKPLQAHAAPSDMFKISKQEVKVGGDREKEIQENRSIAKRFASSSYLQLDLQNSNIKRAKLGASQLPINQLYQQNQAPSPLLQHQINMMQKNTDVSATTNNNNNNNCFVNYYQYLFIQNQPQSGLNNDQNSTPQANLNNNLLHFNRNPMQGFNSLQSDRINKDLPSGHGGYNTLQQQHMQLQQQLAQYSNPSSPFIRNPLPQAASSRHAQEKYQNSLHQRISQYLQPQASMTYSQVNKNMLAEPNDSASDFLGNPMMPYVYDNLQSQSPYPQSLNSFNPLQNQYQQLQQQQFLMGSSNFEKHSNKSLNGQSPSSLKKIPLVVLSNNNKDQSQLGSQQESIGGNNPSTFQKIRQSKLKEMKHEIESPLAIRRTIIGNDKIIKSETQFLQPQSDMRQINSPLPSPFLNLKSITNPGALSHDQVALKAEVLQPIQETSCDQISPFNDGVEQSLIYSNLNKDIEDINKNSSRDTPTFQKLTCQTGSAFTTVRQKSSNNVSPRSACSINSNGNRFLALSKDNKQSSFFKKQAGNNENYSFTQFQLEDDVNEKNGGVSAMLKQNSFGLVQQSLLQNKKSQPEDPENKLEESQHDDNKSSKV